MSAIRFAGGFVHNNHHREDEEDGDVFVLSVLSVVINV